MTRTGAQWTIAAALCATVAVLVFYFSWTPDPPGTVRLQWKEQVVLAGGAKIEIERFVRFHWQQPWAGPRSEDETQDAWLRSTLNPPAFPIWQAPMVPLVLDRDPGSGEWLLVATMSHCRVWALNGQPKPPYWAFRVENGRWMRTAMPEEIWGRPANLLVRYDKDDDDNQLRAGAAIRKSYQPALSEYDKFAVVDPDVKNNCSPADASGVDPRDRDILKFPE